MRPSKRIPGDYSYVEPPDPISNSEVKRVYADGSVHLACESRSSPGSLPENPSRKAGVFLCENINPPALRAVHVQRAWIHANPARLFLTGWMTYLRSVSTAWTFIGVPRAT